MRKSGECGVCGEVGEFAYGGLLKDHAGYCSASCFYAAFWWEKVRWARYGYPHPDCRLARIGGTHYLVAPDLPRGSRGMMGFGGRRFVIHFTDGGKPEVVVTQNLWHQGEIPECYRDLLPDNASFVHVLPTLGIKERNLAGDYLARY